MATIKTTKYTTHYVDTTTPQDTREDAYTHVKVESIRASRLDVSVLRNLVKALDEAGAPHATFVGHQVGSAGHLTQLTVSWETRHERPPHHYVENAEHPGHCANMSRINSGVCWQTADHPDHDVIEEG